MFITSEATPSEIEQAKIVETIHDLFNACGAQYLRDIESEVLTQCGLDRKDVSQKVNAALDHLTSTGAIVAVLDDDGETAYGHDCDF